METKHQPIAKDAYVLATGEAASIRLRLLDQIFGPATRWLLNSLGLRAGLRVAEIGCGSGLVALWLAEQVGASGSVSAVDVSADQLRVAERNAASLHGVNLTFHEASAYSTGLSLNAFDLVYSRFLFCHLTDPLKALQEMRALLKPGGLLVCEDYDDAGITTDPPTRAYRRLVEISRTVHAMHGQDSEIGLKLHRLFREAGFASPEVSLQQSAVLRGETKRFWELTLREAAPVIVATGAATAAELDSICDEMREIANNETTLIVLARVAQVWARKT